MVFGGRDETQDYKFGSRSVVAVGDHELFRVY